MHAYGQAWERISDYGGISTETEFWHFVLVGYTLIFIAVAVDVAIGGGLLLTILVWIAHIPAYLPLAARRLRDAGYDTGVSIFVIIISFLGPLGFLSIIFFAQRSKREGEGDDRFLYKGLSEEKVKSWKDQKSLNEYDTIIQKIERLSSLYQAGHISAEEYESLRKSLTAKL